MLVGKNLFGKVDRVSEAIKILKDNEPEEGYYLAFSGGKDSLVCYWLCEMAGVKYDAHYNFTTVDPPELVAFIRTYANVTIHHPGKGKTMWDLIVKEGAPPNRFMQYCCEELKEKSGGGEEQD